MSHQQHGAGNLVIVDGVKDDCVEDCQVRTWELLTVAAAIAEKRLTRNTAAAKPHVCKRRVVRIERMP